MVRAETEIIPGRPLLGQQFSYACMDRFQFFARERSLGHAGLVGYHHTQIAQLFKALQKLVGTFHEYDLFRPPRRIER